MHFLCQVEVAMVLVVAEVVVMVTLALE